MLSSKQPRVTTPTHLYEGVPAREQGLTVDREGIRESEEVYGRFGELLAVTKVSRSRAYELMNPNSPFFDPAYPKGFSLYDSPVSPKIYRLDVGRAWLRGREAKFLLGQEE